MVYGILNVFHFLRLYFMISRNSIMLTAVSVFVLDGLRNYLLFICSPGTFLLENAGVWSIHKLQYG